MMKGLYLSVSFLPIFADVSALPNWAFITYYVVFLLNLANAVRLVNKNHFKFLKSCLK